MTDEELKAQQPAQAGTIDPYYGIFGNPTEQFRQAQEAERKSVAALFEQARQAAVKQKTDSTQMAKYTALGNVLTNLFSPLGWGVGGATAKPAQTDNTGYINAFNRALKADEDLSRVGLQEAQMRLGLVQRDEQRAYQEQQQLNNLALRRAMQEESEKKQMDKQQRSLFNSLVRQYASLFNNTWREGYKDPGSLRDYLIRNTGGDLSLLGLEPDWNPEDMEKLIRGENTAEPVTDTKENGRRVVPLPPSPVTEEEPVTPEKQRVDRGQRRYDEFVKKHGEAAAKDADLNGDGRLSAREAGKGKRRMKALDKERKGPPAPTANNNEPVVQTDKLEKPEKEKRNQIGW